MIIFNQETYSLSVKSFADAGKTADNKANAFAPLAFAGLISDNLSLDVIVADLCKAANAKSKKGKLLASALPVAVNKAFREVAKAWNNYNLKTEVGEAVREAVDGFIQLTNEEQEAEFAAIVAAYAAEKGEASPKVEAKLRAAFIAEIYPDRPESFAALNKAVRKAIAEGKEEGEGEGEGEGGEGLSELFGAIAPLSMLAEAVAIVSGMTPAEVNASDDVLTELLAAIGAAFARRNEADSEAALAA